MFVFCLRRTFVKSSFLYTAFLSRTRLNWHLNGKVKRLLFLLLKRKSWKSAGGVSAPLQSKRNEAVSHLGVFWKRYRVKEHWHIHFPSEAELNQSLVIAQIPSALRSYGLMFSIWWWNVFQPSCSAQCSQGAGAVCEHLCQKFSQEFHFMCCNLFV